MLSFLSKMSATDIAAWVQAFGSIAALGVAIYLANRQAINTRQALQAQWDQDARNAKERQINSVRAIVHAAVLVASASRRACGSFTSIPLSVATDAKHRSQTIQATLSLLEKMPLHEPHVAPISVLILNLILQAQAHIGLLDEVAAQDQISDSLMAKFTEIFKTVDALNEELKAFADRYDGGFPASLKEMLFPARTKSQPTT